MTRTVGNFCQTRGLEDDIAERGRTQRRETCVRREGIDVGGDGTRLLCGRRRHQPVLRIARRTCGEGVGARGEGSGEEAERTLQEGGLK